MTIMLRLMLLLLIPALAFAQTKIQDSQVATPPASQINGQPLVRMFVPLPGTAATVAVNVPIDGTTLIYDATAKILRAAGAATPAYTEVWNETVNTTASTPAITLKSSGTITALRVYRNGIRYAPGQDYTLTGNIITFAAGAAPGAGEVVLCDYRFQ